jgi:uncharacterized protein HemY
MKNLFLTAALLFAAITTANAQSLKVGNVTVTYNGSRLGEVAEHKTSLVVQILKLI